MSRRDTRREILDTAAELFFKEGFHVGVDRIIEQSGVAKMTFYKHFPAKTVLIRHLLDSVHQAIRARLLEIAADSNQTAMEQLHSACDFLCESMTDPVIRGGLISLALMELRQAGNEGGIAARSATKQIFFLVRRACVKAGRWGMLVPQQIVAVATGSFALDPVFGKQAGAAAKAILREFLQRTPS